MKDLVTRLRVNPSGLIPRDRLRQMGPLAAPLSVGLSCGEVRLSIGTSPLPQSSVSSTFAASMEVAALHCRSFRVCASMWPRGLRLTTVGRAFRLLYTDGTSLTEETAAEAARAGIQLEYVWDAADLAVQAVPAGSTEDEPTACSWDDFVAAVGLWPRPPPLKLGACFDIRMGEGPACVRLSEVSLQEMSRVVACLADAYSGNRRCIEGQGAASLL
eukprot:jgi/Botrbrau1/21472/Bobra.0216s0080.1